MPEAVYDRIGQGYARFRRPDPRIGARIDAAVGTARRIVNVGAGTGSYEPPGVIAVEPSRTMIDQRTNGNVVVQGVVDSLPFADGTFEVAMAIATVHHWPDLQTGLAELRRVAERVVIMTWDPVVHGDLWMVRDYLPQIIERSNLPPIASLGCEHVEVVEVPHDCTDAFLVAAWRRPENIFDRMVRSAASGPSLLDPDHVEAGMARLAADVRSGEWARRNGHLLDRDSHDVGLRILT